MSLEIGKNGKMFHSNYATPKDFYNKLNEEFNFDFDPCPLNHDILLWDGLKIDWGQSNYVNPPYDRKTKEAFILKGIEEYKKGKTVVFLLPVSTSTKIFHEHILVNKPEIRFVKGRIKFSGNKAGTFDNMIIIFKDYETLHTKRRFKILPKNYKS
jgi:site-specific DNA-methyltransferase (adenine-specific)